MEKLINWFEILKIKKMRKVLITKWWKCVSRFSKSYCYFMYTLCINVSVKFMLSVMFTSILKCYVYQYKNLSCNDYSVYSQYDKG